MFIQTNSSSEGANRRVIMQTTKDYAKFRMMFGNRPINKTTLLRVVSEIRNQGQIVPILCNERHEVTDGQHRLEACKQLGIPVKYIAIPGLTIKDAAAANSAGKNWTVSDWIHYHAEMGNKHYQELRDWIAECSLSGLNTTCSIHLARMSMTNRLYSHYSDGSIRETNSKPKGLVKLGAAGSDIRLGYWKTRDYSQSRVLLGDIMLFKNWSFYTNTHFITALMSCKRDSNFDVNRLYRQAVKHPDKFYHCGKTSGFLAMFEHVYNFGRSKKNKLPLVNNPKTCL